MSQTKLIDKVGQTAGEREVECQSCHRNGRDWELFQNHLIVYFSKTFINMSIEY